MGKVISIWLLTLALLAGSMISATAQLTTNPADYYDAPGVRLLNQPLSEYHARRAKLMERCKDGVVVILGAIEEDESPFKYHQNNWMAYFTGIRTPNAALMLVPDGLASKLGAKEIVFIPPRDLNGEKWTGVQLGPGPEAARTLGVERVLSIDDLWPRLKDAKAAGVTKLYTVAPDDAEAQTLREFQFTEKVAKELPGMQILRDEPASFAYIAGEMRKSKSAVELELLQRAIDITGDAQVEIAKTLKPGMFEYQVQANLEAVFTRSGAERPGFNSIVGSGVFSTILHYAENRKRIEDGDLVVCDIGAEYSMYTADITRTFPANGKFTARQRAVYDLVLGAQSAAATGWKPGMTQFNLHMIAVSFMKASPLRAKDVDGKEYSLDHFFIHGLGHYLGMDVHDVGDYAKPLQPGEVFTIEPGIYIPTENLGVRIEDDYTITTDLKVKKMSANIPSAPEAIEALMKR
ncbi:MAG: aminopeptidase P N-terminal domain-containing protein [Pyrinomonadaceae bacterium]